VPSFIIDPRIEVGAYCWQTTRRMKVNLPNINLDLLSSLVHQRCWRRVVAGNRPQY
jgi:hypothetical protein